METAWIVMAIVDDDIDEVDFGLLQKLQVLRGF